MINELTIALIQSNLTWENPKENRKHFTDKIEAISQPVNLIVLPEMFTSGFTMNASKVAETMEGQSIKWLKDVASRKNAAITGSLVILENGHYYNRLVFVHPNGNIDLYDKRHTFTLAGEHKVYTAGKTNISIPYLGWNIRPQICYDLRFPVWARNTNDYDILLYVANWPKPRISAWDALLKARAIENMSYCIGVNRVGLDGTGHAYPGHSACFDVLGQQLIDSTEDKEETIVVSLDKNHIQTYRKKLNFLNDRDDFSLKV